MTEAETARCKARGNHCRAKVGQRRYRSSLPGCRILGWLEFSADYEKRLSAVCQVKAASPQAVQKRVRKCRVEDAGWLVLRLLPRELLEVGGAGTSSFGAV